MKAHPTARFVASLSLGFVLVACGGSSSGDDTAAGNGGGNSGGSSAGGSTSVAGSSGATSGSAGTSASAGTGGGTNGAAGQGGAGGAQAVTPSALYPLAVGNEWDFTTTAATGATSICAVGSVKNIINSTDTQLGRTAFEALSYCNAMTTLSLGDGTVDQLISGAWVTILQPPVAEGTSWKTPQATYTWHGPLSVQVPAGSFNNCWKRSPDVASLADVTYCPGVGTVEIDASTYTTVLDSYSLK